MTFTEKTHAYLPGRYYEHLTACFGERGRAAFIHATPYYASQRGRGGAPGGGGCGDGAGGGG